MSEITEDKVLSFADINSSLFENAKFIKNKKLIILRNFINITTFYCIEILNKFYTYLKAVFIDDRIKIESG
jgi:hypothetical protein